MMAGQKIQYFVVLSLISCCLLTFANSEPVFCSTAECDTLSRGGEPLTGCVCGNVICEISGIRIFSNTDFLSCPSDLATKPMTGAYIEISNNDGLLIEVVGKPELSVSASTDKKAYLYGPGDLPVRFPTLKCDFSSTCDAVYTIKYYSTESSSAPPVNGANCPVEQCSRSDFRSNDCICGSKIAVGSLSSRPIATAMPLVIRPSTDDLSQFVPVSINIVIPPNVNPGDFVIEFLDSNEVDRVVVGPKERETGLSLVRSKKPAAAVIRCNSNEACRVTLTYNIYAELGSGNLAENGAFSNSGIFFSQILLLIAGIAFLM